MRSGGNSPPAVPEGERSVAASLGCTQQSQAAESDGQPGKGNMSVWDKGCGGEQLHPLAGGKSQTRRAEDMIDNMRTRGQVPGRCLWTFGSGEVVTCVFMSKMWIRNFLSKDYGPVSCSFVSFHFLAYDIPPPSLPSSKGKTESWTGRKWSTLSHRLKQLAARDGHYHSSAGTVSKQTKGMSATLRHRSPGESRVARGIRNRPT